MEGLTWCWTAIDAGVSTGWEPPLASAALFATLYALISWLAPRLKVTLPASADPARRAEWNVRIVSFIHAAACLVMSGRSTFVVGPWPFDALATLNTPLQTATMQLSLGYFLFDTAWSLHAETEGPLMLLHHTCSLAVLLTSLISGAYGAEVVACIAGAELTNPALQTRWFFLECGYPSASPWVILTEVLFSLTFIIVRLGFGTALLIAELQSPLPPLAMKAGAVLFHGLGLVWLVQIVLMWRRRLCPRAPSPDVRGHRPLANPPAAASVVVAPGSPSDPVHSVNGDRLSRRAGRRAESSPIR